MGEASAELVLALQIEDLDSFLKETSTARSGAEEPVGRRSLLLRFELDSFTITVKDSVHSTNPFGFPWSF